MLHEVITNDWFILITGVCSIVSLLISVFVATQVIKIDNSMHIGSQKIKADRGGKASGRDMHV